MISLLSRMFIKDRKNYGSDKVRRSYGVLCGAFGIFLNVILFSGKLAAGLLSASVSITADAFNNLSDAGSSLVSLLGFRLAGQKPDTAHPFGHGRFEYISGLVVSMIIILMGIEVGKSSVEKIISPDSEGEIGVLAIIILAASICVKIYMAVFNTVVGKKISSPSMRAAALDSISDTAATSVVLVCALISKYTNINIDGWCGLAVSLFVLWSGIKAAKDTINPLLGQPPTKELVDRINNIVGESDAVIGVHDLMVHDYGPGRLHISLHAEVPANADMLGTHDEIDNIEKRLRHELNCEAVIHMDPVEKDNDKVSVLRDKVKALVASLNGELSIHDFRVVFGPSHTNIIFDMVVPYSVKLDEKKLAETVAERIHDLDPGYYAVIDIDRSTVI